MSKPKKDNIVGYTFENRDGEPIGQVIYESHTVDMIHMKLATGTIEKITRAEFDALRRVNESKRVDVTPEAQEGGGGGEALEHSWPPCPVCGEIKMHRTGDPPPSHDDCRSNPKNAAQGALYPQGPPSESRQQRMARDLRRISESNDDAEGLSDHYGQMLQTLARAAGFDPNI